MWGRAVRVSGFQVYSTRLGRPNAHLTFESSLVLAVAVAGWAALAPVFWLSLAVIGLAGLAKAKIGGQTGDVLGAAQQLAEIAALIVFASLI